MQIVSLSLFRFDSLAARLWAFGMMGAARFMMPRLEGVQFWKLCGSGIGEGFTPVPNTAVYAVLCVWPDEACARRQTRSAPVFRRYRHMAAEDWTLLLTPTSTRGAWSGQEPFRAEPYTDTGPIAALTRATIKPRILPKFWTRVPDISKTIGNDPNVMFKIGIGEVPWLHQITFSIWPNAETMAHFARKDGPHAKAIKAVRDGAWFREELYARFRIIGEYGSWEGQSPRLPNTPFQESMA